MLLRIIGPGSSANICYLPEHVHPHRSKLNQVANAASASKINGPEISVLTRPLCSLNRLWQISYPYSDYLSLNRPLLFHQVLDTLH